MRGDRLNDFAETRDRLERAAAGEQAPHACGVLHPCACSAERVQELC